MLFLKLLEKDSPKILLHTQATFLSGNPRRKVDITWWTLPDMGKSQIIQLFGTFYYNLTIWLSVVLKITIVPRSPGCQQCKILKTKNLILNLWNSRKCDILEQNRVQNRDPHVILLRKSALAKRISRIFCFVASLLPKEWHDLLLVMRIGGKVKLAKSIVDYSNEIPLI